MVIKPIQPAGRTTGPGLKAGAVKPVQPAGPPPSRTPVLTVSSKSKESGAETLIGDYFAAGNSHGKKYYQKLQKIPGHPDIKVFLYFYDNRDGPDFAGWWFGDELGGSNVWARCNSQANIPPPGGWKMPWDALKAEPGIINITPYKAGSTPAAAPAGKVGLGGDALVKAATARVDAADKSAKLAIARASAAKKGMDAKMLTRFQEQLAEEQKKLAAALAKLVSDINEARKAGQPVAELQKLQPRLRNTQVAMSTEMAKLKGLLSGAPGAVKATTPGAVKTEQPAKQPALTPEKQKELEAKHTKEYEEALPAAQEAVDAVTSAVEAVTALAAPLIEDPPESEDDSFKLAMEDIEKSANEAQTKIAQAKALVLKKLAAARLYTAEVRKKAVAELMTLETKVNDAQKTVTPFKTFKKDFKQRVAARKSLTELVEKLAAAELEVEKASMMAIGAGQGSQMSEEELKMANELVAPARTALNSVNSALDTKLKGASGPMREELMSLKGRLGESQKKINEVAKTLKSQQETLSLQSVFETAREKVGKAEDSMSKCGDAELPFLKGIEVLPQAESDKALKDSETAASESSKAMQEARTYLLSKLQEVKRYSPETVKEATTELKELEERLNAAAKRLASFKNDTQERKVTAVSAEAIDAVQVAESKASELTAAVKPFSATSLAETSVEDLKKTIEKVTEAEKACNDASAQARKVVSSKRMTAKDKDLVQALDKLNSKLSKVQQESATARKTATTGSQLLKGKELATGSDTKLSEIEPKVEAISKMSKPPDDGLGVETISDEAVLEMETKAVEATKELRTVLGPLTSHVPNAAASIKDDLTKLIERAKKAQIKIDEARAATKDQRETVLSKSYVKECVDKESQIEVASEKIADAEAPYLKGIEVLAVGEAEKSLAAADEAIAAVEAALKDTRTLVASKNIELKKFKVEGAKTSLEELAKVTERVNSAAQKLGIFKKDTETRKKKARVQQAGAKVDELKIEVAKAADDIKPILAKDAEALSPEDASADLKTLTDLIKSINHKVGSGQKDLAARSKENAGDADILSQVKEIQEKMKALLEDVSKVKKDSSAHTQKLVAKAAIQEAGELLKGVEADMAKTAAACAPLLEEKCERFLVRFSVNTLCKALSEHMHANDLNEEAMLAKMGKKLDQAAFVAFVGKMPEDFKRDECSFSEERRIAMFKSVDADGDGVINASEFKAMMTRRYTCVSSISVTDVFDIGTSKTLKKLEVGEAVDGFGEAKKGEGDVPRLKIKIVSSGEEGWVTLHGNSGTKYLDPVSPFKTFTKELDATLLEATKTHGKAVSAFQAKKKDFIMANPPKEKQEELAKMHSDLNGFTKTLDDIKRKVQAAKNEYPSMEHKEKNAHIHARDQKEADEMLAPVKPKVEALEAELKKLEETAQPLVEKLGTDVLASFSTPLTVQAEVKAIEATLKTAVQETKDVIKQQMEAIGKLDKAKTVKGPMLEAKKEFNKWSQKASQALMASSKKLANIMVCCEKIAVPKTEAAAGAIRAEIVSKGTSVEDLFDKLAAGGDRISEASFVKYLEGFKDLALPNEHAKLVSSRIEADGVSRRSFLSFLQVYYEVVKEIAITPEFNIDSKDKPVRKADLDEIFSIVEGPKKDEESGLLRVKVKALVDGATGWVSVKGNAGKIFLEEVQKPFFYCTKNVALEKEFKFNSENLIRTLKPEEVMELLEGPRQETLGNATRVKGKAVKDGKVGYFTLKDQSGTEIAEKNTKMYTCTATVAITDSRDIKDCKVLKKMLVDEVFTATEGPIEDESGVSRVKGKSTKDDTEGWITIKGNAGSVFAKANEKLYTIKKDTPMNVMFNSDSKALRTLAADEAIEMLEAPKEERFAPVSRAKVQTSTDRAVGWITVKSDVVQSWQPLYKVAKTCDLYSAKGMKETVVREISQGENLELQEGPLDVDGDMWMRARVTKDGAVGWVVFKDDKGVKLLVQAGPAKRR